MKKVTPVLKTLCAATILAIGSSAYAERVIVKHDAADHGLKKGHQVLAQGNDWFAVELSENGKSSMRGKKGFKNFEVDPIRYLMSFSDSAGNPADVQVVPYGYVQSESDQLSLQSGQKVCVIDSGIAESNGETGGYNADFNWSQITGDNDSGTGNYNSDGGGHGTHVAGTVGAADNGFGVIGMAPGVPMHIIKVFNAAGYGYSSDLAQAANLCAAAGANIINMSLGGGGANSTEENAFNSFRDNGGLVIAAAGNDGNNVRSYPAGYEAVMMVGAVDANDTIADFSQFPPTTVTVGKGKNRTTATNELIGVEITAGGVTTLSTVPSGSGAAGNSLTADGATYASFAFETAGSASGNTYFMGTAENTDAGANGKICMIDRGNIAFGDKVANCQNSGGIGAVIINNVAGLLSSVTLGDPITTTIPAVGAALEDRAALLAASTAAITIDSNGGDYDYYSGTSMATPTVAGVAALVWSNHPTCSGEDVRAALKASAQDQGDAGRDDVYGYGIVKAKAASDYLTANGCDGGPIDPPPAGDPELSGSRSKGNRQANLSWSGLEGSNVDVYSNGSVISTTANDGSASFSVSKNASYTFQVCAAGTSTCTNSINL